MSDSDKVVVIFLVLTSIYNLWSGNTVAGILLSIITALIIGFYAGKDYNENQ
ncbi:MAG: hypothetical protein ACXWE9_11760 [Methylobacter sp.]